MRKSTAQTTEHVNPNLIPMIDIMFLLLLFFMLGADMGHRELESVTLPQAKEIKPDTQIEKEGRLTINAHHRDSVACTVYPSKEICRSAGHWEIAFRGKDCTDEEILTRELKSTVTGLQEDVLSNRRVMIRADAGAPFGLAQRAMNVCARNGIYKIEVGAAKPKRD